MVGLGQVELSQLGCGSKQARLKIGHFIQVENISGQSGYRLGRVGLLHFSH